MQQTLRVSSKSICDMAAWQQVMYGLGSAVSFDFSRAKPTLEHARFGTELVGMNLFRLPFPSVFFDLGKMNEQSGEWSHFVWTLLACADGDACAMTTFIGANGRLLPFMLTEGSIGDEQRVPRLRVLLKGNDLRIDDRGLDPDFLRTVSQRSFSHLCGAVALLMSRDVETTVEPPPLKLNLARARKGRPAVGEARLVKIKPDAIRRVSHGDEGHASPVMHWRRGHFRTIYKGTEKQRVVPVAPCLVGATDEARSSMPKPQDYVVGVGT